MTCKLQPVLFTATKFTVLDEFDGKKGLFLRGFLVNNKMNQNGWMVTNQANIEDGKTFLGRPDIEFFNNGKRDHTVGDTFEESLKIQEPFTKGTILKIIDVDGKGTKLEAISEITDTETKKNIRAGDVLYYSPAIFPRSLRDVEIIPTGPSTHMHIIHRYKGLHRALVDDPAYGKIDAKIGPLCDGTSGECMVKLAQLKAGIGDDEVKPIREEKIINVKKCDKTGNIIFELKQGQDITDEQLDIALSEAKKQLKNSKQVNSNISNYSTSNNKMDTEEEREKEIAKLSAQVDELVEDKKETAKKSKKAEVEEEEKKKEEAKKGGNEEITEEKKEEGMKGKKGAEEEKDKKIEEQSARIAVLEDEQKIPFIDKYIAAKSQMPGFDEAQIETIKTEMEKASLSDVKLRWEEVEPFVSALQISKPETKQESKYVYGMGGHSASSTNLDGKTTEELLEELGS